MCIQFFLGDFRNHMGMTSIDVNVTNFNNDGGNNYGFDHNNVFKLFFIVKLNSNNCSVFM